MKISQNFAAFSEYMNFTSMKSVIYLMEWLNNVTNQMDSFGLMANDIGLDSCHLEAVDESHNENRDWNGAIKD